MLEGRSTSNVSTSFEIIITHQANITTVLTFELRLTPESTLIRPQYGHFDQEDEFIYW